MEYIVAVAKTGSLSTASQQLHVTQSAISQSITNFETELGVKIFRRSRLGAEPTAEGKPIIRKAYEVLSKIGELKEEAEVHSNFISGELRVATVPGTMTFLVKALSTFKISYPNVRVEMTEKSSREIIEEIKQNKLDIGVISIKEDKLNAVTVDIEVLMKGKMIVAVSRHSPLALYESLSEQELHHHAFVLYQEDSVRWFIDDLTSKYGPVDILFWTNNLDAIRSAVREGLAITVGSEFIIKNDPYILQGEGVPIEITGYDNTNCLGLVRSEKKQLSLITKNFVRELKSELFRS
ncbi:LysR family transcriptional regulator [Bacillus sp. DNRA2]|uniref:LysR family transcriptional regulator n=1 Tax=Bacillus sp. DNRA2 TaxID=2723053 RepID=UPI00145CDD55|nr:LysR family transcriptional regulator [Bacillus sp. DNRA2]NMD69290.1 LysR family transcriptional regulator [Bacillus sp. DNRA2]